MMTVIKKSGWISTVATALLLNTAIADTYTPPSGVPAPSFANDFVVIDGAGNPADSRTGYGGVNYKYRVSATQITVGDWVTFLNAVDPGNTMGFGPIGAGCGNSFCFSAYTYSGSSWSVTAFTDDGMNMSAAEAAKMPIDWLSLNMVGRYMNWLATGNINNGAFTFSNTTSANASITSFDATYPGPRLPLEDELYKAMFWNADTSSYDDYPTTNLSAGTPVIAAVNTSGIHNTNVGGALIPGYFGTRHYAQVGQELGNPWGLFDVTGNRHETTLEPTATTTTVLRGASAFDNPATADHSLYSFRQSLDAGIRYVSVGYRVWMGVSADSGTLSITKTVTGGTDTQTFSLQLDCDDNNFDVSNISLKDGETYHSDNIPVGVQCTITETTPSPPSGYTYGSPVISPSTVTIQKDQDVAVSVTNPLSVAGCPTITVTPDPLADGTVGVAYSAGPSASSSDGNTYTYIWSAASLPAGLNLNSGSGAVSGTPTAAGSGTITASATVAGQTCSGSTALRVNATGSLTVSKTVTGAPPGFTSPDYTVHVDCSDNAFDQDVTLISGSSQTISNIPDGTTCTVTEPSQPSPPTGYSYGTAVITPSGAVTIAGGSTASVSVENPLSGNCVLNQPTVTTQCHDNGTPDTSDDTFSFDINATGAFTSSTYDIQGGGLTVLDVPYATDAGSYGNYLISGGNVSLTLTDSDNASCQLSGITATAPAPCSTTPVCTTISNMAGVTSMAEADDNTGNDRDGAVIRANCGATQIDLELNKASNQTMAKAGDTVTYTLTISNKGPDDAQNVAVTDQLPGGVTYVSSQADRGSYDSATGVWTIGDVASGIPLTLTITVTVD